RAPPSLARLSRTTAESRQRDPLHPGVPVLADEELAVHHRDAPRLRELACGGSGPTDDREARRLRVEQLKAIVVVVAHDDATNELTRAAPANTERRDEAAVGGEVLKAVVAVVRDPDVAGTVDDDARRICELAVARSRRADRREPLALGTELLHAVVLVLGDVE